MNRSRTDYLTDLSPTSSHSHPDSSTFPYLGAGPSSTAMTTTASTISSTSPRSHTIPNLHKSDMLFPQSSVSSSAASSTRSRHSSISAGATGGADNLIDVMEKEQEGIVLKLMKEIQSLKDENKQLKQQLTRMSNSSSHPNLNLHIRSQSVSNPISTSQCSTSANSSISTTTTGGNGTGSISRSNSQRRSLNSMTSRRYPSNVSMGTQPSASSLLDTSSTDLYSYTTEYRSKKNRRKSTAGSISFGNYSLKPPDARPSSDIVHTNVTSSHNHGHYLDDVTNSPSPLALKHNERR